MTEAYFDPTPLRAPGTLNGKLAVWIDESLCTGDSNCATNVPEVFVMKDGLAYVVGDDNFESGPGQTAIVPDALADDVVAEALDCPGECIFVEVVGHDGVTAESVTIGLDR